MVLSSSNSETTGFLVSEVARLFRQHFERALLAEGRGLTSGESRTLFYVSLLGGVRQAVLAEKMLVEPMTLSGFLDRLEQRDLITRMTDPDDRRAKIVTTTEKADSLLEQIRETAGTVRQQATNGLSEDEIGLLHRVLNVMRSNLGNEGRDIVL
ncbi:DNA-binding transcriptional regulator, MarR family [Faunimonas pinastri]|uniref:DNA-binding transcriptional regulator, MarR family n=1 Tax=Faunimonas pinastri TaxID=1855383 RepID=A0A1H9MF22_9HYPH|nr:MarR family transcriptional regulator [Faunimonas pinastri]SER22330.1 DNA-binding transcriptional regulator, MarR family [Faunimonas pinastri]